MLKNETRKFLQSEYQAMSGTPMASSLAWRVEKPYFIYTEKFKSGYVHKSWSAGNGIFFSQESRPPSGLPCFTVDVNHANLTLSMDICSESLKSFLTSHNLLMAHSADITLNDVLLGYESLTSSLAWLENNAPGTPLHDYVPEMRLLASDFLQDRDVFGIFGLEHLYEIGLLHPRHWQDIQRCSTRRDIHQIERAVSLDSNDDNQPADTELLDPAILLEIRRAIRRDDLGCVRRLLAGHRRVVDAYTLDASLRRDQLDIFWALLSHKAVVNGDLSHLLSEPLYTAAKRGHVDAVTVLLERGACVDGAGHGCSYTPLCGAASGGFLHIVQLLHKCGADINGNGLKTPLVAAVKHGHTSIVQYLLDNGADVNQPSYEGHALFVAVKYGHTSIVQYLLDNGADVNRPSYEGHAPFVIVTYDHTSIVQIAVNQVDYEMTKFLLERRVKCGEERLDFAPAVRAGNMALVRLLLFHNFKPQMFAALTTACELRHFEIALVLSLSGARVCSYEKTFLLSSLMSSIQSCPNPCDRLSLACLHLRIDQLEVSDVNCNSPWGGCYFCSFDRHFLTTNNEVPSPAAPKKQLLHVIREGEPKVRQRILGACLRRAFGKLSHRVLDASSESSASEEFASLALKLGSAATAWKKGMSAIRKLIDRCAPESLDQVISCLLVADAMRTTVILGKDPTTQKSTLNEFLGDLNRWRSLLRSHGERSLYDEIVRSVWGARPVPRYHDKDDSSLDLNIAYLQKLVSNIVWETSDLSASWEWNPGHSDGYRLHSMHRFYNVKVPESDINDNRGCTENETSAHEKDWPPDGGGNRPKEALWDFSALNYATESQRLALMLMAGAVFGIVLIFLVVVRWDISLSHIWNGMSSQAQAGPTSGEILARNCMLLILYLGVQSAPAPASTQLAEEARLPSETGSTSSSPPQNHATQHEPFSLEFQTKLGRWAKASQNHVTNKETPFNRTDSPSSSAATSTTLTWSPTANPSFSSVKPQPTCPRCGKSFSTNTNRNKHLKYDCHKALKPRFPCRNKPCKSHFSREAYRNKHEQTRCRVQQLRVSREES